MKRVTTHAMTPLRTAMLLRRARMHLGTARWLAQLRGDRRWERACRTAIRTLARLDSRGA